MTRFQPQEDVVVAFGGRDHHGECIRHSNGWVVARIRIDPLWDYGSVSARLDPVSTVCVRETDVRHAEKNG